MPATRRWTVGYLLTLSAGIVFLIGAALPWATVDPTESYNALQLRLYVPLATTILAGTGLIALSILRTPWAAFGAIGGTIATVLIEIMIHGDEYGGLTRLGLAIGGDTGHVGGFGTSVLFMAGALCVVAAVSTAIESEPPVRT